ncbi:hypothetical protein HFP69_35700 [Streptomyces sp. ARC12]|uniref:hypothetical protein n=1 Tax=Streptomyces sp. ARC12 TaxID=2724151 RepID=UPI003857AD63
MEKLEDLAIATFNVGMPSDGGSPVELSGSRRGVLLGVSEFGEKAACRFWTEWVTCIDGAKDRA